MCSMATTDLRLAVRETLPIGLGYVPLGIAFGLFAVSQGFPWWLATITALIIYSGSMEFIAVGLITGGASFFSTALTTFFVSFRHIFYGLSVPIRQVNPAARPYAVHALTDEAWALLSRPSAKDFSGKRIILTELFCHLYWVFGTTLGAVVGSKLPWDLSWMGFALTALFVVLSIEALETARQPALLFSIALVCGVAAQLLIPDYMMVGAMTAYAVISVVGGRWLK